MRENCPFPAMVAETLPATVPTVSTTSQGQDHGHSAAKYPHRRLIVESSWRAARAWISLAFPTGLDRTRPELTAAFPELVANIDALELAAQQEASTYQNEPNATPGAFQAHLAQWQAAVLDACAALAYGPGQLELEVAHD